MNILGPFEPMTLTKQTPRKGWSDFQYVTLVWLYL